MRYEPPWPSLTLEQLIREVANRFGFRRITDKLKHFDWNNPGYEGIRAYEEHLLRQNSEIRSAEVRLAAHRATQSIDAPDAIIEKIKTMQQTISMEKVATHMMFGGMP